MTNPRPLPSLNLPRRRGSLLEGPAFIEKELAERAPAFVAAARTSARAVGHSMAITHEALRSTAGPRAEALKLVMTQTANDWVDLLYELIHGRGRAALRGARSMFEHCVTAAAVSASDAEALRYQDHLPVADRQFLELARIERHLRGGALKAHRHEVRKLDRETRNLAVDAVARYGAAFRRSWSELNLRERAIHLGLDDGYAFYRVASLPVHGAAAGVYGGKRVVRGHDVYRTGPFLAACPLAAIYGVWFCAETLHRVEGIAGPRPLQDWERSTVAIEAAIPEYIETLTALDAELWPDRPPVNVAPMLVVKSRGESELWLALPDAMLAYDFLHGDYRPTREQAAAAEALFEVLARLDIDRLGVIFVDAWDPSLGDITSRHPQPLDAVVPHAPIQIFPDGVVGVPSGLTFEPYLNDLSPATARKDGR